MKNIIFFALLFCSIFVNAQHYQYDTTYVQTLPIAVTADSVYLFGRVHTLILKAPEGKFQQVDNIRFAVSINANTLETILKANQLGEAYSIATYQDNPSSALEFQVAGTNSQYDIQTTSDSLFTSFQLITKIKNVPVGKFEQADNGKVGDLITTSFSDLLNQIPAAGVALKNKLYPDIP